VKTHLFYTFLVIFAATAIVTLLGVTNVIVIREGYLTALVSAFLIELAGAVIAIFKSANFFAPEESGIAAEEDIRASIRKLDAAFGFLHDRQKAQEIHFHSRMLASQHLAPTPRTDIMVLLSLLEKRDDKLSSELVAEALGAIADVLNAKVHIGSSVKSRLVSFCRSLPSELAGAGERVLHALDEKQA
jgi:hypothetical protein